MHEADEIGDEEFSIDSMAKKVFAKMSNTERDIYNRVLGLGQYGTNSIAPAPVVVPIKAIPRVPIADVFDTVWAVPDGLVVYVTGHPQKFLWVAAAGDFEAVIADDANKTRIVPFDRLEVAQ